MSIVSMSISSARVVVVRILANGMSMALVAVARSVVDCIFMSVSFVIILTFFVLSFVVMVESVVMRTVGGDV